MTDGNATLQASNLSTLHIRRGAQKRKITDFLRFISVLRDKEELNINEQAELEIRILRITPVLDKIEDIQNSIYDLDIEDAEEEQQYFSEVEAIYYTGISEAKALLESYRAQVAEQLSPASDSQRLAPSGLSSAHYHQYRHIKLPTITLPKFDGKYAKWLEFHDVYLSLVHEDESLSDIQRFHYLKSSLEGDASEIIKNLQLTATNYSIAWKLLCERYTNKKLLIQNHLKELFSLEMCTKESASQLREMLDKTSTHLRSLEALKQPVEHWDSLIIYLITSKFDKSTARDWECIIPEGEFPTLKELQAFLSKKADILDSLYLRDLKVSKDPQRVQRAYVSSTLICYCCKAPHAIYNCKKFLGLSIRNRILEVKKLKLCGGCLRNTHTIDNCAVRGSGCRICKGRHNTLLHMEKKETIPKIEEVLKSSNETTEVALSSQLSVKGHQILLATAMVKIKDIHGHLHDCRALLDSGSQSSFITHTLQSKLGLSTRKSNIVIRGINQLVSNIKSQCIVNINSRVQNFNSDIKCLVLEKICDEMPSMSFQENILNIPHNLDLADPNFATPDKIDIIIGAQLFWSLLIPGQISLGKALPTLQNTKLGWIISGPFQYNAIRSQQCFFANSETVQQQLQQFWELEECPKVKILSPDQELCETIFKETLKRDKSGRYVVSIPLKNPPTSLGESRPVAQKRLLSSERRFKSNVALKNAYIQFMEEYEALGHMTKVKESDGDLIQNFLPHHIVVNESSKTTKYRVVFDGSCPTSNGVSFNDLQLVGPTVQNDLFTILLQFRQHTVAFSADVQKMYRQILINPTDRPLQRILWRTDPSLPIQIYELNTVTYGTASAPFLATRCLVEVANEFSSEFPDACTRIRSDFYVDDILSGADTPQEVSAICSQIQSTFSSIHFPLHKWVSNVPEALPKETQSIIDHNVQIGSGEMTKTLGLYWSPRTDILNYKISTFFGNADSVTKRLILSQTSQVYDPLGLVSPCIIVSKIILQRLWMEKLDWDDKIPEQIATEWFKFRVELLSLNELKIPRHVLCSNCEQLEIHCFCDASEQAYAACLYLRSINAIDQVNIQLLCAKTKVAPLKKITIPRLELCGAHLAANLLTVVKRSLRFNVHKIFMWSDSTIVLGWIKTSPNLLKVFVSHRIADIQAKCSSATWRHVSSQDNPADLGSRGISPSKLKEETLWWHGPQWLKNPSSKWPDGSGVQSFEKLPEIKRVELSLSSTTISPILLFTRFSNFNRLLRCLSYVLRFIEACRKSLPVRSLKCLSVEEIEKALLVLVKLIQKEVWSSELKLLSKMKSIPMKSQILCLNPFVDSNGILRVGGRLQASNLEYSQKHQILLPKHYVTFLLFKWHHIQLKHAGPQLLLTSIRDKFWPLGGRNYARKTVHDCIRCFRCKPSNVQPIMGNLPADRVIPSLPFQVVGIDYAGPLNIKDRKGRGCKISKCYLAIFVCLIVKAVHIELVSSLSTEAFLAALKRFICRRGLPNKIYSDNGSNFVGANRELLELFKFLKGNTSEISESLSVDGISWSFIPPKSPNFGGLWEAAVKGVKNHLKRVVGDALLTYEQLITLLTQIESILNSRPLTPLSSDPNDLEALTPSHFLIGRKLRVIPEPCLMPLPTNRLSEFQRIQQLLQNFWARWKREYLQSLQIRTKQKGSTATDLKVGTMVLVQDESVPPFHWPIGRIVDIFPGSDGIVRVVCIKTIKGTYKRAAAKVFPLPGEQCAKTCKTDIVNDSCVK